MAINIIPSIFFTCGTVVQRVYGRAHFTWSLTRRWIIWIRRLPELQHYQIKCLYTLQASAENDCNVIILSLCLKWRLRNVWSNIAFTVKFHKKTFALTIDLFSACGFLSMLLTLQKREGRQPESLPVHLDV